VWDTTKRVLCKNSYLLPFFRCLTFEHYYRDACSLLDHWERAFGMVRPLTPPSKPESETIDSAVGRGVFSFLYSVTLVLFTSQPLLPSTHVLICFFSTIITISHVRQQTDGWTDKQCAGGQARCIKPQLGIASGGLKLQFIHVLMAKSHI